MNRLNFSIGGATKNPWPYLVHLEHRAVALPVLDLDLNGPLKHVLCLGFLVSIRFLGLSLLLEVAADRWFIAVSCSIVCIRHFICSIVDGYLGSFHFWPL